MSALQRIFAGGIGLIAGIEVFIGVFFAPVLIYGSDDILLAWGWVAPFVGLPLGLVAARFVDFRISSALSSSVLSTSRRWLKVASVVIAATAVVAGLGQFMYTFGDVSVRWSEEVKLSNGKSVVVTQTARGNAFGRSRVRPQDWLPTEFTIEAPTVLSSTLHTSLRPVLLDRDPVNGGWHVLAEPTDCASWYKLGNPAPPYIQYSLEPSGWTQITVDTRQLGRSPNLLRSPRFTGEEPMISAEQIQNRNDSGPKDSRPQIRATSLCS